MKEDKYSMFIEEVDALSCKKLRHKRDLQLFISSADKNNKINEFLEIIFFAKFITKLYHMLQKSSPGVEGYDKVKEEFSIHIEKLKKQIEVFIAGEESKEFNKKFLSASPESFVFFMELIQDLSWIKNHQIDNKKLW